LTSCFERNFDLLLEKSINLKITSFKLKAKDRFETPKRPEIVIDYDRFMTIYVIVINVFQSMAIPL